jgi:hypothetical protein
MLSLLPANIFKPYGILFEFSEAIELVTPTSIAILHVHPYAEI